MMRNRNGNPASAVSNASMVCVVPKQNVEILGRALHALARIGDELYVEPLNGGLTFRTVHHNHSVYAEVHFNNQFFSFYNIPDRSNDGDDDNDVLKCRINMKSYLAAFRSLPCLRRQVETCLLQIEPTWLIVKFRCHHSLIRTYRLPVIETETLQAIYTVDEVPNYLVIGADIFSAAVKNFQFSERDITLAVDERKATLRNYVPGGTDPTGVVRSELKLDSGEFISFTVGQETAITFCLKAFRAVLYFSEPANLPLAIKFSSPGSPVVVISSAPAFELRFVLSSLAPEDCDTSRNESQQLLTPLRPLGANRNSDKRQKSAVDENGFNSLSLSEAWGNEGVSTEPMRVNKAKTKVARTRPGLDVEVTTHRSSASLAPSPPPATNGPPSQLSNLTASSTGAVVGTSRDFSERRQAPSNTLVIPPSDDETEEEDVVPASPPPPAQKKARIFFQRCFEPTLNLEVDLEHAQVLAFDSDED